MTKPRPTQPSDTPERIVAGLSKLSLVLRHEAWQSSGERGLTPTQSQILSILAGSTASMGVKEVARQMAITMGTASEAVSSLVTKGLVRKQRSASDGRAVVLSLTKTGSREASTTAEWPASMVEAVESLPEAERAGLLRGLIGMIRSLQEQNAVPTARMCVGCTHFRPNEYPGTAKPHHCGYIDAPIGDTDLRIDCEDMNPHDAPGRDRLWELFINGQKIDSTHTRSTAAGTGCGNTSHSPTSRNARS